MYLLSQKRHLVEKCAQMCFAVFENAYRDLGIESAEVAADNLRKSYLNMDKVPLLLVALAKESGDFLGTITLDEEDMSIRRELKPWLSDLLVVPLFRGQGVASILVSALIMMCRAMKIRTLYLWVEREENFFSNRGFKRLQPGRLEYAGSMVALMYMNVYPEVQNDPN